MKNNYQEIFDKVYTHLKAQGVAATNGDGSCVYRGANGTMCAVGCLIPDDQYNPDMEGNGVYELYESFGWKLTGVRMTKKMLSFLHDLQAAHDDYLDFEGMDGFINEMRAVARRYDLNTKVIDDSQ